MNIEQRGKKICQIKKNRQVEETAEQPEERREKKITHVKVVRDQDVKKMQNIEEKKQSRKK